MGTHPTGIAVDPRSDTVYVANASDSLTLIDGRTCNASASASCERPVTVDSSQSNPLGIAIDDSTGTVYVTNAGSDSVSVIDARTCNAIRTAGCNRPALVHLGSGSAPEFLAVDPATHTIYVADSGRDAVSVIDGRACNATDTRGCGAVPVRVSVGAGPELVAFDAATSTVWVADSRSDTVSLVDTRHCTAADVSGCGQAAPTVQVGFGPLGIAIDADTGTVYVGSSRSNSVSVFDGRACAAAATSACTARTVTVGIDPRALVLDPPSHTVYVADEGSNGVSLLDAAACNATATAGCTRQSPLAPVGLSPRRIAIDQRTRTVYVTNAEANSVSLVRAARCTAARAADCKRLSAARRSSVGL